MTEATGAADDRADMEALINGDDRALNRLMGRHGGPLLAYLRRLLQNDEDAEDLAQETFVRVYEHRRRFDLRRSFSAWLYSIAANLVRDRYRWRSRHPEVALDRNAEPTESAHAAESPALMDARPHPAQELLLEERSRAVRAAIGRLPPELRAPLLLAEFENRSHAEIGTILGCSAKAVELRVYRARQALRRALAPWLRED